MGMNKMLCVLRENKEIRRKYFSTAKEEISNTNLQLLIWICIFTIVIEITLLIFAKILLPTWVLKQEHFQVAIINVGFIFLATKLKSIHYKNDKMVANICMVYMLLIATCIIKIDVFYEPETLSSFIPLLFVVTPAAFVLSLFRIYLTMILVEVEYIIALFMVKDSVLISADIFYSLAGLSFGMLVTAIILRLRCKDNYDKLTYRRLSMTDSLTGVQNKSTARTQIGRYLLTRIDNTHCALLIIDLDNFKKVNDKYGHQVGDRLLNQVGEILHEAFRGNDIVGRFGGDEFVVLMKNVFDDEIIERKCEEILKLLESLTLDEENFKISCSMGAVIAKKKNESLERLFKIADDALYEAKAMGKNGLVKKIDK